jgi:small subunit ribosomal protein S20
LANTKSAIKHARQNANRRTHNRIYRLSPRTHIKKVRRLVENAQLDEAQTELTAAISALDKAAQKGVIHKNNAARRKSRLAKLLRKAQQAA